MTGARTVLAAMIGVLFPVLVLADEGLVGVWETVEEGEVLTVGMRITLAEDGSMGIILVFAVPGEPNLVVRGAGTWAAADGKLRLAVEEAEATIDGQPFPGADLEELVPSGDVEYQINGDDLALAYGGEVVLLRRRTDSAVTGASWGAVKGLR